MNSCLIIAGEKSGEEHVMTFFPELVRLCPETSFFGVGGDDLKHLGMENIFHLKDFSSMGFSEVVGKIPFYLSALKKIEDEVLKRGTKTAILVDFQDFNMRLAQRLKKRGVKVLYYVAPQAWVWKPHRAGVLAKTVHTLFTILPFEKDWFSERGVKQIRSIPHPLMVTYKDKLKSIPEKKFRSWNQKVKILLLPGSRKFEVYSLLPEFIKVIHLLKQDMDVEVQLVKVKHINPEFYKLYQNEIDKWYESEDLTHAMNESHFALAASGTVTLSTGLFEIPTIVCYRASLLNEFIFNNFIKYDGPISLTNIIHHEKVFPEFVQGAVDPVNIAQIIRAWTTNEKLYNELKTKLRETKTLLSGEDFSVSQYISQVIHE